MQSTDWQRQKHVKGRRNKDQALLHDAATSAAGPLALRAGCSPLLVDSSLLRSMRTGVSGCDDGFNSAMLQTVLACARKRASIARSRASTRFNSVPCSRMKAKISFLSTTVPHHREQALTCPTALLGRSPLPGM